MRAAILATCGLVLAACQTTKSVPAPVAAPEVGIPTTAPAPAPSSLDQKIAGVSAKIEPYCGAVKVGIALLQPSIKKQSVANAVAVAKAGVERFCANPIDNVPEAVAQLAALATDLAAVYAAETP